MERGKVVENITRRIMYLTVFCPVCNEQWNIVPNRFNLAVIFNLVLINLISVLLRIDKNILYSSFLTCSFNYVMIVKPLNNLRDWVNSFRDRNVITLLSSVWKPRKEETTYRRISFNLIVPEPDTTVTICYICSHVVMNSETAWSRLLHVLRVTCCQWQNKILFRVRKTFITYS